MAVLYITEYAGLMPSPVGHQGQVPMEPPLAEQTVAIGVSHAESAAFNAKTKLIRIHTDAICSVVIGTAPAATSSSQRFAAGQTEFKGVPPGGAYSLSVITNS